MSYIAKITGGVQQSKDLELVMKLIQNRLGDPNLLKVAKHTAGNSYEETTHLPAILAAKNSEGKSIPFPVQLEIKLEHVLQEQSDAAKKSEDEEKLSISLGVEPMTGIGYASEISEDSYEAIENQLQKLAKMFENHIRNIIGASLREVRFGWTENESIPLIESQFPPKTTFACETDGAGVNVGVHFVFNAKDIPAVAKGISGECASVT